jgi:hypothetical protein
MICTPVCLVVVLPSGPINWTAHRPGGFLDVSVFSMSWGFFEIARTSQIQRLPPLVALAAAVEWTNPLGDPSSASPSS